ncbi:hypothetical protein D3C79_777060 [compost metagenome]
MRIVANALEHHGVGIGHQLLIAFEHMDTGNRVDRAVDQPQRHPVGLQCTDPALAVGDPLGQVSDQLVQNARAAVGGNQAPVVVQRTFAGMGAGPVDLGDVTHQIIAPERAPDQPAQAAEQQLLDQQRPMTLGEQTTIEEHATGDLRAALVVAGEQLLGDAAAIIMPEQMHRLLDLKMREQCLLQVGLLQQAVIMVQRFGRVAKAEHVTGNHPKTLGQGCPQVMPVPAGGGKAMNEQ